MADVSKGTVIVLLVLTIVVSVIGTYSFLSGIEGVARDALSDPVSSAKVKIRLLDEQPVIQKLPPKPDLESSEVYIQIQ